MLGRLSLRTMATATARPHAPAAAFLRSVGSVAPASFHPTVTSALACPLRSFATSTPLRIACGSAAGMFRSIHPVVCSTAAPPAVAPRGGLLRLSPTSVSSPALQCALLLQRCGLGSTSNSLARVHGKGSATYGSGASNAVENVYSPMYSSSTGGGSSGDDALPPHVRQHLLRVYSLVGMTSAMAMVGSALMIMTPLCTVVPFWFPMIAGFVPLLWLSFAPPANPTAKTALLLTFGLLEGMAIAPLVLHGAMKGVVLTSLMLTAAVFGGFSAAAFIAPRASLVAWQGPLFGGLIGLVGLSLFSVFYPTAIAHSIILYGGLALFSVMVAADTQALIERARCGASDHVSDALGLFLNMVNIFIRILQIMSGRD